MYCSRGRDRRLVEEGKVGTSKGPGDVEVFGPETS